MHNCSGYANSLASGERMDRISLMSITQEDLVYVYTIPISLHNLQLILNKPFIPYHRQQESPQYIFDHSKPGPTHCSASKLVSTQGSSSHNSPPSFHNASFVEFVWGDTLDPSLQESQPDVIEAVRHAAPSSKASEHTKNCLRLVLDPASNKICYNDSSCKSIDKWLEETVGRTVQINATNDECTSSSGDGKLGASKVHTTYESFVNQDLAEPFGIYRSSQLMVEPPLLLCSEEASNLNPALLSPDRELEEHYTQDFFSAGSIRSRGMLTSDHCAASANVSPLLRKDGPFSFKYMLDEPVSVRD